MKSKRQNQEVNAKYSLKSASRERLARHGSRIEDLVEPYPLKKESLLVKFPAIAALWYYKMNCGWRPEDFSPTSGVIAWWRCPRGRNHIWRARILDKTRNGGTGCPFCANRLLSDTNNLLSVKPELKKEWFTEKNKLPPNAVTAGSMARAWWRCPKGPDHIWRASINERTKGSGCPFCINQKLSVTNSLAALFPDLAEEWDAVRNKVSADEVVGVSSISSYWWICRRNKKHRWQATCSSRVHAGSGCPKCNRGEARDLRKYPMALACFDKEKNKGIDPHSFSRQDKIWWRCPVSDDHVWRVSFHKERNDVCPFCRHKRASKTFNLKTADPMLVEELSKSLNKVSAEQLIPNSHTRVWWQCRNNKDHVWQTVVYQRFQTKSGCPFCGNSRVSKDNNLAKTYPAIAKEWHQAKNGDLTPFDVVPGSNTEVWWQCRKKRDHLWQSKVNYRVQGRNCPFCRNLRASSDNCLAELYPDLVAEWHPRNEPLTPRTVTATSNKKVWWKCTRGPDHEWEAIIYNRTQLGTKCPCCANRKLSITNNLAKVYPSVAREWHPERNGDVTARDVFAESGRRAWWQCRKGHEWNCRIQDRTVKKSGCPECFALARSKKRSR